MPAKQPPSPKPLTTEEPRDSLERTLTLLQRGLAAHQGRWAFYLLKFNHGVTRQRISATVRQHFKNPHELRIDEQRFPTWLDLENHLGSLPADIDLIETSGLDTWLTPERAHHWNARREPFAAKLHCPLLAWLTPGTLATLASEASDLWDWRSGVFDFSERELAEWQAPAMPKADLSPVADRHRMSYDQRVSRIDELTQYLRQEEIQARRSDPVIAELFNELAEHLIRVTRPEEAKTILNGQIKPAIGVTGRALARTHHNLGNLEFRLGQPGLARNHYELALPLYQQERSELGQANTLRALGDLELHLGQSELARSRYDQALRLFRQVQDGLGQANTLFALGNLEWRLGQLELARSHYDQALSLFQQEQDGLGQANTLRALGDLELRLGQPELARSHYDQALHLYRQEQAGLGQANTLLALGNLEWRLGQPELARSRYDQALPLFQQVQDGLGQANTLRALGDLELRLGQPKLARGHYEAALGLYRQEQEPVGLCCSHGKLARTLAALKAPITEIAEHRQAMHRYHLAYPIPSLDKFVAEIDQTLASLNLPEPTTPPSQA